jgi:hypothetical protein
MYEPINVNFCESIQAKLRVFTFVLLFYTRFRAFLIWRIQAKVGENLFHDFNREECFVNFTTQKRGF